MADFGSRLRKLRKENNLRQKDLAQKLNLAQTTIANYEKNARFPNQEILNQIADYFYVSLDYLLARSNKKKFSKKKYYRDKITGCDICNQVKNNPTTQKYFNLLLNGKKNKAADLIIKKIKKDGKISDIYRNIFEPALKKIGILWEKGEITVDKEHYFSNATLDIMAQLHNYFPEVKTIGHTIIGVTAGSESHSIGLKMIINLFELKGWTTFYYGTNTPNPNIINAIKENKADILAISATIPANINSIKTTIKSVRKEIGSKDLKIIVGGNAFKKTNSSCKETGADGYAKNLDKAVEIAENLITFNQLK